MRWTQGCFSFALLLGLLPQPLLMIGFIQMNNCFFYAVIMWLREPNGYLAIRWTRVRFGWWPHFIFIRRLNTAEIYHYVPTKPKAKKILPPPLFRGEVKDNDE